MNIIYTHSWHSIVDVSDQVAFHKILSIMYHPHEDLEHFHGFITSWEDQPLHPLNRRLSMIFPLVVPVTIAVLKGTQLFVLVLGSD